MPGFVVVDNQGADQPVHWHSLITTFVTVNSKIFASFIFAKLRKFRENKNLVKCRNQSVFN